MFKFIKATGLGFFFLMVLVGIFYGGTWLVVKHFEIFIGIIFIIVAIPLGYVALDILERT